MSMATDRSCPNCGNVKGVGKVSSLYYKAQADSGNTVSMSQLPDGHRRYPARGVVIDRPQSKMAKNLAPPAKPTAKGQSTYDIRATGFVALLAALLISGILMPFVGWDKVKAIFLVLFLVGLIVATVVTQQQRRAAFRKIPLWEKAMDRWDEMYYCLMCDGVYIPGERVFAPIAQKDALAYQSAALKLDKAKQPA